MLELDECYNYLSFVKNQLNMFRVTKIDIAKIFSSQNFLFVNCLAIFLLSIFLRSIVDTGADTGFYIDLGQRIYEGKKYYYDFFESNLPLSFYFYALQKKLAIATGINPIIMSEIFINLLGLLSIYFAASILRKSAIYKERKDHYNLIIISFFLGFFLRIGALPAGEFGTKTSLFLLLLYPYIAYSLLEKQQLTKLDLLCRGTMMGLMPCLKPHYFIIVFVMEFYHWWQKKSYRFFLELDKLIAALLIISYLNFIIKYTPEYIEFMVPMWGQFYSAYADIGNFINNTIGHLANKIILLSLLLPMFFWSNFSKTDKILALFFIGASSLIILESIGTIDQEVIFFSIVTTCLLKFSYDFFSSRYFSFYENRFVVLTIIFIPFFDTENFFVVLFNLVNMWFLLVPIMFIFLKRKNEFFNSNLILYFILTAISLLTFTKNDKNLILLVNLISFLIFFIIYEKSYQKLSNKSSFLLVFVALSVNSYFAYFYVSSIKNTINKEDYFTSPNKLSDEIANYTKLYASGSHDSYLVVSNWIAHQFPLMNYLEKPNYFKYAVAMVYDSWGAKTHTIVSNKSERAFVFNYLLDDFKRQLQNPKTKIIFINQDVNSRESKTQCNVLLLEYYLQDPYLKKLFIENFRYQSRILKYKKFDPVLKIKLKNKDKFDELKSSKEKILYDFEVYIRK